MMPFNGSGSYLVRNSQTNPGEYSLSVRDRDQVIHYRIWRLENGKFFIIRRTISFDTIIDLITHYQQQADGLCRNLIQPCALSEKPQTLNRKTNWEIDRGQIRRYKKLVEGQVSEVWEGVWNGTTPVAVKIYKPQNLIMTAHDFLQTAALMKKLRHPNIVQIYAVCTLEEPIYIITELMKHNSLLEYLRGKERTTKFLDLVDMASQVAGGMAYLEKKNYIHRDLAARSILVGENLICKVANFDMARVINEAQSQAEVSPKWTAPEALSYNRFTIKSDVWSFGIVLYEIITYGDSPYPAMTTTEVLEQLLQGYRMPRPMSCPEKLYDIMLHCWREEPANRSTFETLQWQLEEFFTAEDGGYR